MDLLADARPAYTMSGEEAVAALDVAHAEIARLETYRLKVTARLDETGYTKEAAGQDTARFLSTRYRRNLYATRQDLTLAKALPKYPAVTTALPDPYTPADHEATIHSADAASITGTDATDATDASGNGGSAGAGGDNEEALPVLLHPEQAEAIVSALEAVPAAAMVSVETLRVAEEQMVEAARHLAPADLKKFGQRIREILDTDGPEPAEGAAERRESLRLTNADHGVKFSGYLANANAELLKTLIEAAAKPRKMDGELDCRSRDKRQADALTQVLTIAAGTGDLPSHGGVKPHVTVTIDYTDLKTMGRDATGNLQFGDNLSAAAVRCLACDAGIIPIVLGSNSEPLDVGREERFVTKAIRRALNKRDKGCVVCGLPPRYCHAHHIVHWIDGGPTSLDNLALFCGTDHKGVHAGHYTVTITNGKVHVTRPTWAAAPRLTKPLGRPSTPQGHPYKNAPTPDGLANPSGRAAPRANTDLDTNVELDADVDVGALTGPGTFAARSGQATMVANSDLDAHTASGGHDGVAATTCEDDSCNHSHTPGAEAETSSFTGTDNDPFWGQGRSNRTHRPVRVFSLVNDPPPLAAQRPADFDPWAPETLDTG
ncbi:DUF222 domain-containing protein [Kribbella qitaiheensis]|uniref:DUF222 domain-containing protein n=1 Tax=Kribbella qitaiheensis TaxID=1544730 RepID=A0A7G6WRW8_9ACTN|nr:HNH endonuclease signature motif containing protein [Kribbella qitaiheensis]QNE16733.1 DUF222 domain-containing protein [Kribbella qitaiheensis]